MTRVIVSRTRVSATASSLVVVLLGVRLYAQSTSMQTCASRWLPMVIQSSARAAMA